ncbi:transcription termination factor Rho [Candidatus Roizmanbacteria bacterium CG22_combo_CG10-13_8_21_14_all_38_20]|uniref:Transcription termination factor Rho n=1 Tax=Candidatus Roizmanbacteria bacterium CG22_combo_CG10-13_8_21_14_all_38_20 TaxID=1974862 RepID=A0A2H0BV35_9BACT|nr:transcription termination factor Rho [Candidatus Microgenomates bacterium]PIP61537.1 MAG: transcription termination factor Rho [Candidatus Roizmanbacteria bacterium CG22_combo_CG10-13_8_21_14_all_38_20]PJC31725.1 MAG: transcription termination factor Rho [Candidatus Roizmanbacteria bacterium CG_4_9_14_0_2_um_filter_38_17]
MDYTLPNYFRSLSFMAETDETKLPEKSDDTEVVTGILDLNPNGHGFLRPKFHHSPDDIYISQSQIHKFWLRSGDQVSGIARPPKESERYWGLLRVDKVNGDDSSKATRRPKYDELVPIYPDKQLILETDQDTLSTRIIDLISPIGFGQRGLIVSQPQSGKTTVLKDIAHGVAQNFPDAHIMAVLIGERPEEVTDMSRSIKGEVVASNFDEAPEKQTRVAEIALDRARRLVELGKDVVVLLDSITRLARAYNLNVSPSGRTLSGGFDPAALYPAKHFLGAARNCEGGGSLTIIGTALVDTGSRMDELIYEEFKGTGNMEVHLSRKLANRRIYPAIDIDKSSTRKEELLISKEDLPKIVTLRNMLSLLGSDEERIITLISQIKKSKNNKEFLDNLKEG